jgi:hypothetical protein
MFELTRCSTEIMHELFVLVSQGHNKELPIHLNYVGVFLCSHPMFKYIYVFDGPLVSEEENSNMGN